MTPINKNVLMKTMTLGDFLNNTRKGKIEIFPVSDHPAYYDKEEIIDFLKTVKQETAFKINVYVINGEIVSDLLHVLENIYFNAYSSNSFRNYNEEEQALFESCQLQIYDISNCSANRIIRDVYYTT